MFKEVFCWLEIMENKFEKLILIDCGGRRKGSDRRRFVYSSYLPERRSGEDRRSGKDRRKAPRANSRFSEENL